jgi:hypothetical protein
MRGLDPRIHRSSKNRFQMMDCRVKPGNDGVSYAALAGGSASTE